MKNDKVSCSGDFVRRISKQMKNWEFIEKSMNENEPAPTGKGMYWTGVVMSVIPSLMLLMASVMSLSKSAHALQGMAQFGYPENAITAIGAAALVSTILRIIPPTAVLCPI